MEGSYIVRRLKAEEFNRRLVIDDGTFIKLFSLRQPNT